VRPRRRPVPYTRTPLVHGIPYALLPGIVIPWITGPSHPLVYPCITQNYLLPLHTRSAVQIHTPPAYPFPFLSSVSLDFCKQRSRSIRNIVHTPVFSSLLLPVLLSELFFHPPFLTSPFILRLFFLCHFYDLVHGAHEFMISILTRCFFPLCSVFFPPSACTYNIAAFFLGLLLRVVPFRSPGHLGADLAKIADTLTPLWPAHACDGTIRISRVTHATRPLDPQLGL